MSIPGSLEPLGGKGLWARWEQAEAGSPPSQHTPLTPAHSSSLQPPSSLPALSSLPACSPHSSSLQACSQLSQAAQLAPACSPHSSLLSTCSSSLPAHSSSLPSLQLAPACSQLTPSSLQLTPSSLPACSSSLPMAMYVLGSPPPVGCKGLWGKVGASWSELGSELEQAGVNWGASWSKL